MPPPGEVRSPGAAKPEARERLTHWLSVNRPRAWLVILATGLILFLAWMPSQVRGYFWRRLQAQPILGGMTLGFGLLAISLLWSAGQRLDAWAFLFLNLRGLRPPWLDRFMWILTQIGNGIAIAALALVSFFAGEHLFAYDLILGALTLWLAVEVAKVLTHRGRPFTRLTQARIVGQRAGGRSFPSGHTAQAFYMATLLAGYLHAGSWLACALYALAMVVGITRMYVGAHYPRDVLAGAILGSAWGVLGGILHG